MTSSDDRCVRRSVDEPMVFEELIDEHGRAVHGYLARRAGSAADDLSGEVWLAAFESRSAYDADRGGVRAWLLGIARHTLFGHYRRHLRDQSARPNLTREAYDVTAADWAAVDARLDAAACRPVLREGLRGLSPGDREVLLLVAWEQLTPAEAAAVVGIPQGTARSRLHRAREQLRVHLTEHEQLSDVLHERK